MLNLKRKESRLNNMMDEQQELNLMDFKDL